MSNWAIFIIYYAAFNARVSVMRMTNHRRLPTRAVPDRVEGFTAVYSLHDCNDNNIRVINQQQQVRDFVKDC